jgi:hypothetical protein
MPALNAFSTFIRTRIPAAALYTRIVTFALVAVNGMSGTDWFGPVDTVVPA